VERNLTIRASDGRRAIIDGQGIFRNFPLLTATAPNATGATLQMSVTLQNIEIVNANCYDQCGVQNFVTMTIEDCHFHSMNSSKGFGIALYSEGVADVSGSLFTNIYGNHDSSSISCRSLSALQTKLTIHNSDIVNNTAGVNVDGGSSHFGYPGALITLTSSTLQYNDNYNLILCTSAFISGAGMKIDQCMSPQDLHCIATRLPFEVKCQMP
jgi:hypothetical protein